MTSLLTLTRILAVIHKHVTPRQMKTIITDLAAADLNDPHITRFFQIMLKDKKSAKAEPRTDA